MTNPRSAAVQPDTDQSHELADPLDFVVKDWIMQNIHLNDPVEIRRNELLGLGEAAGFENIDVRNLGEAASWEMRFNRGRNTDCTTVTDVEQCFGDIARRCGCQIEPGQFVALVLGDQLAARFKLRPIAQPV